MGKENPIQLTPPEIAACIVGAVLLDCFLHEGVFLNFVEDKDKQAFESALTDFDMIRRQDPEIADKAVCNAVHSLGRKLEAETVRIVLKDVVDAIVHASTESVPQVKPHLN